MRDERPVRLTRRGRATVALVVLLLLLGLPAGAGYTYLHAVGFLGASDPGRVVEVVIPEGAGAAEIGRILESAGVIKSSTGFRIAAYFDEAATRIQAGRYELPTGLSARDALAALEEGSLYEFVEVTIPEGSWLTDFARIIGEETHIDGGEFLEMARESGASSLLPEGVTSMEGLLFPATYEIVEDDTAETVLKRFAREFENRVSSVDWSAVKALGYSRYEAVIVASMVEAEAAVDEDRARIARVIYNRLEEGIQLGIDATVLYALGEHKAELTQTDLNVDSPYNTRRFPGLPPTPIGAPGMKSLEAAAHPAPGSWMYYVLADCDGRHAFSSSYDEFLEDKSAYRALDCG